ncbi:MAG TPA: hypothetical protein PLR88_03375 [Bacteroidales bacterium]|nr:hypothetical protein [Bacteroidales bacterium]HPT20965.1 hypothetical protein [Bacteroidales bacterium]
MKKAFESGNKKRNLDQLISKLSENEILNPQTMIFVRGGEGEANGSEPIIIIPKPLH